MRFIQFIVKLHYCLQNNTCLLYVCSVCYIAVFAILQYTQGVVLHSIVNTVSHLSVIVERQVYNVLQFNNHATHNSS